MHLFTMSVQIYNTGTLFGGEDIAKLRAGIDDAKRFSVHYDLTSTSTLDCSFVYLAAGVGGVQIGDFSLSIDVEPVAAT